MSSIMSVSDAGFKEDVLDAELPVLVDFWAPWCGPCQALSPILEEVAQAYEGRVRVLKLNVDDNPETPQKYAVRGIPTLMVFKGGECVGTKVGHTSKSQLMAFIEGAL